MKMHWKNFIAVPEDYSQSPHIFKSIQEGSFSQCRIIAQGYTTEDITKVTCKRCLEIRKTVKALESVMVKGWTDQAVEILLQQVPTDQLRKELLYCDFTPKQHND
tara:strand:- start:548 stop:862 length:315 start_codon:yes stop_codon:yes gene_type:complete